jgi:hypothetical protein
MTRPVSEAISQAAALLLQVARSTRAVDDGARLRCLAAVDALQRAGAEPVCDQPIVDLGADELIRQALRTLAGLPIEVFETDPILNASADARRALLEL